MPDTAITPDTLEHLDEATRSEVLARAFWALGNPVRMRIVRIVMEEGEKGVGELVERLPVSQPQVSAHLKCLGDCGFLEVRREGRRSLYRMASPWLAGLLSLMTDHAETHCAELLACAGCTPTAVPAAAATASD